MQRIIISILFLVTYLTGFGQIENKIQLPSIFSDHIVLQQKMQVPVWGNAQPNSMVVVQLAGFTGTTKANAEGKWMIRLPEMNAGGPFEMKIWDKDTIKVKDVMIGEVWLASGQSNMEWQVGASVGPNTAQEIADANYPNLRYFSTNKQTSSVPLQNMGSAEWKACTSLSVKDMSAVAYFFGREILKDKNIAVGIINASWGATSVETWMSAEMLKSHPNFTKKVEEFDTDPIQWKDFVQKNIKADRSRDSISNAAKMGITAGVQLKNYDDTQWEKTEYPMDMSSIKLGGYWGFVWFRKTIEVGKEIKLTDFTLRIPVSGRSSEIYINGKPIEIKEDKVTKKQTFLVHSKQLSKGKNVIAIRLLVNWGSGNVGTKDVEADLVSLDDKTKINLTGEWRFNSKIEPEIPQWQDYYNKINVLYNGEISSLIPYGIRGAIWYQGENNAGKAYQYRTLFPMLIEDWRVRWGQGYFPFLFVQLANFREKQAEPAESDWAELREAQLMTLKYPNTGMAVTIDIGDANDIHPKNKLDVGKRLYLAAQRVAYNENVIYSGPIFASMKTEDSKIRISFTSTGSGLTISKGQSLKGFAIAGADKKFYWAEAIIDGNEIIVSSDKVLRPAAVRYSWATNPDGNLYNKEGLPASPFRTDHWKGITED
ncbi:MAG TPA: sialate O-acetylesterase [Prolixibacteraceae bacterium]